jgi:hypothetical protein
MSKMHRAKEVKPRRAGGPRRHFDKPVAFFYGYLMSAKSYYYLIDNLTGENALKISKALKAVSDVLDSKASPSQGVLEVKATRDVEAQVKMACEIAGATFRTRMSRKSF